MENQSHDKNKITTINKVPTTTKRPFQNTTMVFSWPSFFKSDSNSTKQGQMKNPDTWKKKANNSPNIEQNKDNRNDRNNLNPIITNTIQY
jgi:hypothetical protein